MQAVVDSATKVDNKDIIYMTEMLMRVLLKLDGIVAEGEGRLQRKMEVSIMLQRKQISVQFSLALFGDRCLFIVFITECKRNTTSIQ